MKKLITLVFALALISTAAQAEPVRYTYDPAHTQIIFSVNHLGFSNSHGKFNKFSGEFTFDEVRPESSRAEISIDTASIDMDSEAWNTHLKNADFFNVEKFPSMTFKSTAIKVVADKTAQMTGDLTLLGVTKPVTLTVKLNKIGEHPMNKNKVAGFSMTGTLKRSDFGMNYGIPNVGDDVNLIIEVEGIRQDFDKASQ